jgi:hypothetical protein
LSSSERLEKLLFCMLECWADCINGGNRQAHLA